MTWPTALYQVARASQGPTPGRSSRTQNSGPIYLGTAVPHPCLAPQLLRGCRTDPRVTQAWSLPGRNAFSLGAGSEPAHVATRGDTQPRAGCISPPVWGPLSLRAMKLTSVRLLAELKLIPKPSAVPELSHEGGWQGSSGVIWPPHGFACAPIGARSLARHCSPQKYPESAHPCRMTSPAGPSPEFLTAYGPSQRPAVNSPTRRPHGPRSCSSKEHVSLSQLESSPQIALEALGLWVATQGANPRLWGAGSRGEFTVVRPLSRAAAAPGCSQDTPGAPPGRRRTESEGQSTAPAAFLLAPDIGHPFTASWGVSKPCQVPREAWTVTLNLLLLRVSPLPHGRLLPEPNFRQAS